MSEFVSIIIPCRNEEKYIGKCLETLFKQDYPKDKMEILIVDGMSEDKTRTIIENCKLKIENLNLRLLDNPKKFTPFGLNIGIKNSKGEVIIIMGAHAGYEKDYISKCLKYLQEYNADNIGGIIKTMSAKDALISKAIAFCLSSFFGAGGSWFRTGSEKIREVDTVFGGCYKREVFEKTGLFDERLVRSQDIEFNRRLKKAGGKILLAPEIIAFYYPQSSFFAFFKHNFKDGIWTILPLKWGIKIFSLRHLFPLFFVLFLPLTIFPYILANLYFSFQIARKERDFRFLFLMPIVFFCRHFSYGLGSIWGLAKLAGI